MMLDEGFYTMIRQVYKDPKLISINYPYISDLYADRCVWLSMCPFIRLFDSQLT